MLKQAIFLSLCALLVSGCGSPYVLNIDTVPTGATIWQAGATSSYPAYSSAIFGERPRSREAGTAS